MMTCEIIRSQKVACSLSFNGLMNSNHETRGKSEKLKFSFNTENLLNNFLPLIELFLNFLKIHVELKLNFCSSSIQADDGSRNNFKRFKVAICVKLSRQIIFKIFYLTNVNYRESLNALSILKSLKNEQFEKIDKTKASKLEKSCLASWQGSKIVELFFGRKSSLAEDFQTFKLILIEFISSIISCIDDFYGFHKLSFKL